jgi:branched-chain amino acid transport system substrate-binding protein
MATVPEAMEAPKPKVWTWPLIIAVVAILLLASALGYTLTQLGRAPGQATYPIGLAFALEGGYVAEGPIRQNAAVLAIQHMNDRLEAAGSPIRFAGVPENTKGTPQGARDSFARLASASVKVVVGPLATTEATGVLDFINANHIVAISPSSTGISAAIPNDFMFRAPPTDIPQAKALAQLVNATGYTKVAIIFRNDDYGKGFADLFQQRFETVYGGQVSRLSYDACTTCELATQVGQLSANVQAFGSDARTAVLVAAFDPDGIEIFQEANLTSNLRNVRWFGSESMRRATFLNTTARPEVVNFVRAVNLTGFFASPALNPISSAFENAYKTAYPGQDPARSPYTYYAYDAAMLGMMSVLAAGKYDGDAVKSILPSIAANYLGASGHKAMDANGDAIAADYVAWHVWVDGAGKEYFREFARWRYQTEELEFYP